MKKLSFLGLLFLLAFTVTGCQLYFGEEKSSREGVCLDDGYYVGGEWVSAQCPGGGNACTTNKDCAAGCFCDTAKGTCEEGGFCKVNTDCPAGYKCDTARSSCVPGGASCTGPIAATCTNGAPKCPQGSVPLIENGCYYDMDGDGQFDCSAVGECASPPTCDAYQFAADCAAASCTTVTRGENCTMSSGAACLDGQPGCICQHYVFARCEPKL